MKSEKEIREFIHKKVNQKDRGEITYIELVYTLQRFCKELQAEAINYVQC